MSVLTAPLLKVSMIDEIAQAQVEEVVRDTLLTLQGPDRVTDGRTVESRLERIKEDALRRRTVWQRLAGWVRKRPLPYGVDELRVAYAYSLFRRTNAYPANVPPEVRTHLVREGLKRDLVMASA